jgi:hypothetical protein
MRTRILAAAAAAVAVIAGALMSGAPAEAAPVALQTFRVTIKGTASGNAFTQTGTLTLHRTITTAGTRNGLNPLDVCLRVGFPAGLPAAGAIWLGTNSACFPFRRADLDMGQVGVAGNALTFTPDSRLQATNVNLWTGSGSVTACPYSPGSGSAVYRFNPAARTMTGTVRLSGYGGAFCGRSTYAATLTGVRTS